MARMRFKGLREYELMLSQIEGSTKEMVGRAIYAGADVVADAIRAATVALPTVSPKKHGTESDKLPGITSLQKAGLLDGLGITPMSYDNGYYNVKIGWDGYNSVKTKKYPKGQPNQMIARSINTGTSFRTATKFAEISARKARPQAEQKMKEAFEKDLKKIAKG